MICWRRAKGHHVGKRRPYDTVKRVLDVFVASVLLVVLSPVLLLVGMVVRCTMGRGVLFQQLRCGKQGRPFTIYKFRSMRNAIGLSGEDLLDSDRLTSVGRFLRATSLDELPELLNIVRGEMSLVGPRPLLMEYVPLYSAEQGRRHEVRPGLTGWAQVNGRNTLAWERRFELDVWYVDSRSFWLDVKILLMTVVRVLLRHGISHKGEATMSKFTGPRGSSGGDAL